MIGNRPFRDGKRCIIVPYFSNEGVKIKLPNNKTEKFGGPGRNIAGCPIICMVTTKYLFISSKISGPSNYPKYL